MSFAAAFLLAASATQAAPADGHDSRRQGPVFETAKVSVEILRPAVLKDGKLVAAGGADTPRSQRLSRDGRLTYEFE